MTAPGPGGYRAPTSPAPVSGPGQLSQRTDGGPAQQMRDLPDAKYGENAAYQQQQMGAPLAKAEDMPTPSMPMGEGASRGPISPPGEDRGDFHAPTGRPDEPVTAGAPMGPGRTGDYAAPVGQANVQAGQLSAALTQHFAEDPTGILRLLANDLAEMGV